MAETQNLANVVLEKDRNIAELQNRIRILEECNERIPTI